MSSGWKIRRVLHRVAASMLVLTASLLLAGCGESDPGALGPMGVGGGLSPEGQKQDYEEGVVRALVQLTRSTQGETFARAVDTGNARQLQAAALAWRQGGEQLKQLNPPKDAGEGHAALIKAVDGLDSWNRRIVEAAPNRSRTQQLARQASQSPASMQFEAAVCQLVDAGYEVVDSSACSPLENAGGPIE